ncbi:MAG: hypothetical protein CVU05_00380 [Bacteroidetes bacterium HGW-Bacteroidetes-21]|jgi:hypothetical protein|nr:MAG: hypothetical protein CVU05_00380 [Bacteroidetes bacterium HGW-Bacteroidetes-21]
MKTTAILIILITFFLHSFAQNPFKVISVNGEILAKKANVNLQSGLEVKSDDNFAFIKPNSRAALINPDLGRVILTEQNSSNAFNKAAFAPAMSSVSTRGTSSNVMFTKDQVSTYFSEKLLVVDRLEIKISNKVFPMNSNAYFFIRYMYNGDEINKRLSYKSDTLIIDKSELYAIDGKPIPNPEIDEMKLYYYEINGDNSKATFISSFNLVFIPNEQLKSEVQLILDACKKQSYERKFSEVYDFLTSFYGAIDQTYVESWLDITFGLKKK